MRTYDITVNDKELQFRLTTGNIIKLTKAIGKTPLQFLVDIDEKNDMPDLKEIGNILFYALQPRHKKDFVTVEDVYDLIDEMTDDGYNIADIIAIIVDIEKVSGIIPKVEENIEEEKN